MRKFVTMFLSCALLLAISIPVKPASAATVQPASSPVYEEKGQIVLKKIEMQTSSSGRQAQQLSQKLKEPQIQNILDKYMKQGKTPIAIGWTKVYLKEAKDAHNKTNLVPMTIADLKRSSNNINPNDIKTGTPTSKNWFTLYTLVGYDNYDPEALFAESVGEWDYFGDVHSDNDDFITLSWPANCILYSSDVTGDAISPTKEDEAYSSVVWGYGEAYGTAKLLTNGRDEGTTYTRKWVSKYVHTWDTTVPSFSISLTGVGITLSNASKSWQIASSVIF